MRPFQAKAAPILLLAALLVGACDRSSLEPSPAPAPAAAIKASDAACALPLRQFAPRHSDLVGSILDHPTNLVAIDGAGRIRWNSAPVEPRRLAEYVESQARAEPPIFLKIVPDRDAPCALVQETLNLAIGAGRCGPERCSFEWPGAMAPPLLPERSKLLGNWVVESVDGSPPPPKAPPIEVIFTDGEVGARSQCVSFAWLYAVEEGQLRLRVPNRLVGMCARGLSDWEKKFQAAMPAASYIESDGTRMFVAGPKGKLILKRPD